MWQEAAQPVTSRRDSEGETEGWRGKGRKRGKERGTGQGRGTKRMGAEYPLRSQAPGNLLPPIRPYLLKFSPPSKSLLHSE